MAQGGPRPRQERRSDPPRLCADQPQAHQLRRHHLCSSNLQLTEFWGVSIARSLPCAALVCTASLPPLTRDCQAQRGRRAVVLPALRVERQPPAAQSKQSRPTAMIAGPGGAGGAVASRAHAHGATPDARVAEQQPGKERGTLGGVVGQRAGALHHREEEGRAGAWAGGHLDALGARIHCMTPMGAHCLRRACAKMATRFRLRSGISVPSAAAARETWRHQEHTAPTSWHLCGVGRGGAGRRRWRRQQ